MSDEKGRDHDEEDDAGGEEDGEKVWVQTNEGQDGEERERVRGCAPGEQTFDALLEHEDHANAIFKEKILNRGRRTSRQMK